MGLFFFEGDREAPGGVALDRKSAVLVHALDDPGHVWRSLAPELVKEDFNVWLMQYPNDQPIVESARLFFEALKGLNRWISDLRLKVSDDHQKRIDELGEYMISMTHGLGDGLVTVESTRLEGVPHRIVGGTHLSMIRNITQGSRHIPPAVPIIIDQLKRKEK